MGRRAGQTCYVFLVPFLLVIAFRLLVHYFIGHCIPSLDKMFYRSTHLISAEGGRYYTTSASRAGWLLQSSAPMESTWPQGLAGLYRCACVYTFFNVTHLYSCMNVCDLSCVHNHS